MVGACSGAADYFSTPPAIFAHVNASCRAPPIDCRALPEIPASPQLNTISRGVENDHDRTQRRPGEAHTRPKHQFHRTCERRHRDTAAEADRGRPRASGGRLEPGLLLLAHGRHRPDRPGRSRGPPRRVAAVDGQPAGPGRAAGKLRRPDVRGHRRESLHHQGLLHPRPGQPQGEAAEARRAAGDARARLDGQPAQDRRAREHHRLPRGARTDRRGHHGLPDAHRAPAVDPDDQADHQEDQRADQPVRPRGLPRRRHHGRRGPGGPRRLRHRRPQARGHGVLPDAAQGHGPAADEEGGRLRLPLRLLAGDRVPRAARQVGQGQRGDEPLHGQGHRERPGVDAGCRLAQRGRRQALAVHDHHLPRPGRGPARGDSGPRRDGRAEGLDGRGARQLRRAELDHRNRGHPGRAPRPARDRRGDGAG